MPRKGVTTNAIALAKWSVLWVGKNKKGKTQIFERDCGYDLTEAVRIRDLCVKGGKKSVTLRCKNTGFPPPERLMPHPQYVVVEKKGKRYKKRVGTINPLSELNLQGIYWCPFCMKVRKFVHRDGFWIEGIWVDKKGLYCPMCDIYFGNHHVRRWNPHTPMTD